MSEGFTAWRLAVESRQIAADDLSGQGSARSGGRWNSPGEPVVYAASSISLACLETIVHLGGDDPLPLVRWLLELRIPPLHWEARTVFHAAEHPGWDARPWGPVSEVWGTAWLHSRSSLLAEVPSVIVPEEANVLINPVHPAISALSLRKVRRWRYDTRLLPGASR
jgi:RES domain-containing protein